jgi:hypothetical protein
MGKYMGKWGNIGANGEIPLYIRTLAPPLLVMPSCLGIQLSTIKECPKSFDRAVLRWHLKAVVPLINWSHRVPAGVQPISQKSKTFPNLFKNVKR